MEKISPINGESILASNCWFFQALLRLVSLLYRLEFIPDMQQLDRQRIEIGYDHSWMCHEQLYSVQAEDPLLDLASILHANLRKYLKVAFNFIQVSVTDMFELIANSERILMPVADFKTIFRYRKISLLDAFAKRFSSIFSTKNINIKSFKRYHSSQIQQKHSPIWLMPKI